MDLSPGKRSIPAMRFKRVSFISYKVSLLFCFGASSAGVDCDALCYIG